MKKVLVLFMLTLLMSSCATTGFYQIYNVNSELEKAKMDLCMKMKSVEFLMTFGTNMEI